MPAYSQSLKNIHLKQCPQTCSDHLSVKTTPYQCTQKQKTGLQPSGPVAATASPAISRSPRTGLASRGQGQGVQGWKMTCLRPAPPTRSFFQADKRNTLRRKEVEQSSYEDDLQILRVIEAYCVSKHRQTITNSGTGFTHHILPATCTPHSLHFNFRFV